MRKAVEIPSVFVFCFTLFYGFPCGNEVPKPHASFEKTQKETDEPARKRITKREKRQKEKGEAGEERCL